MKEINYRAIRDTILIILVALVILALAIFFVQHRADNVPLPEAAEHSPEPTSEIIEVESIDIILEDNEILVGYIFEIDVIIQPYNATDKSFEIISDDESVVRQHGNNWIAVDAGVANLIATASNGIAGIVEITVIAPEIEMIALPQEDITMALGDVLPLTLIFTPEDAVPTEPIVFTSDDEEIATVSDDGEIAAVGVGTTTINAIVGDAYLQVNVTVIVPARSITISTNRNSFIVGDEAEIIINIDPPDATNVLLEISFEGAPVTQTGPYTFICDAPGEVIITFTTEDGRMLRHTVVVHDLAVLAEEVFRLTNEERVTAGLSPFEASEPLSQAAYIRAQESIIWMAEDHARPDGRPFYTVLTENDVEYRLAGENLAAGQMSAAEVVRGWMDSPGHRRNILNADFGRLGVGVTISEEGRLYWTQLFTD